MLQEFDVFIVHCPDMLCAVPCVSHHTPTQQQQLDQVNHQVASRVASAFTTFKQYDKERQQKMVAQLRRIAAVNGLSDNVFEVVTKSLQLAEPEAAAAAGGTATV